MEPVMLNRNSDFLMFAGCSEPCVTVWFSVSLERTIGVFEIGHVSSGAAKGPLPTVPFLQT